MALKAYSVLENNENTGAIYFAEHAIVARRLGANDYADGDLSYVTCRRAPWADEWANKDEDVPARIMIANGWHFECCGCGARVDEDYLYDEDLPLNGVIGTQRSRVFCSEICECEFKLHEAIRRDRERRMIDVMKSLVLKRFPTVKFSEAKDNWKPHAHAEKRNESWQVTQAVVSFAFPGMKIAPASYRFNLDHHKIGPVKPHFTCCFGDKEAFEAWADSDASRVASLEAVA